MRFTALTIVAVGLCLLGCERTDRATADPATREAVWLAIQPIAERYQIEPTLIYALVAAESNFDPKAQNGEARGLMQLKPGAWRQVSSTPYEPTVWDWRRNLESGIDYLAQCRNTLHKREKFSYPLLLASFHFGIDYVRERDFNLRRIESPDNAIYREMRNGNLSPVPPPKS